MSEKIEEFIFMAGGILFALDTFGVSLQSSNNSSEPITFLFNDNVYPPYISCKFLREDVIKIRDWLNDYLKRTEVKDDD